MLLMLATRYAMLLMPRYADGDALLMPLATLYATLLLLSLTLLRLMLILPPC